MSTELENNFDEILKINSGVFFVDDSWAKSVDSDYTSKFSCKDGEENCYEFNLARLTEKSFVLGLSSPIGLDLSIETSSYRVLSDAFTDMQSGVIIFHNTHLQSSGVIHLISRIIRFSQRGRLSWKFVFFGDSQNIDVSTLDQLFIDEYFPATCGPKEEKILFSESSSSNEFSYLTSSEEFLLATKNTKKNGRPKLGKILFFIFLPLLIGSVVFFLFGSPNKTEDLIFSTSSSAGVSSTELAQAEVERITENEIESREIFKELVRQSEQRDLEFKATLAELNANIQLEQDESGEDENVSPELNQQLNESLGEVVLNEENQPENEEIITKSVPLTAQLEQAIKSNDLVLTKSLVDDEKLSFARNETNETPLIIAVNNGSVEIVEWFIEQDVPVDSLDGFGRSALFYAAVNGNSNLVGHLIDAGAKANFSSSLSKTPLMAAVHNNHYDSAQLLLATQNAGINVTDHSGWSALFYAVWNKNIEMVQLLLENRASQSLVDDNGMTIKQVAETIGFAEAQALL